MTLRALLVATGLVVGGTTAYQSMVVVRSGATDPTCATATAAGDLCVEDAIEANGALDIGGASSFAGNITSAGTVQGEQLTSTDDATITDDLAVGGDLSVTGAVTVTSYDVDYVVAAGTASLGPTAPTWTENDSCDGLTFDADNESAHIVFEVPDCWAGGTADDLMLKIYWCPEDSQAPADTEVVKWDISYRSIDWTTEDVDNGTAATGTVSYTQSGAGDEGDTFEHEITIDADDANQPLAAGDVLAIHFDRDFGVVGNYPHDAIVMLWEITVPQTSLLCDHQN